MTFLPPDASARNLKQTRNRLSAVLYLDRKRCELARDHRRDGNYRKVISTALQGGTLTVVVFPEITKLSFTLAAQVPSAFTALPPKVAPVNELGEGPCKRRVVALVSWVVPLAADKDTDASFKRSLLISVTCTAPSACRTAQELKLIDVPAVDPTESILPNDAFEKRSMP